MTNLVVGYLSLIAICVTIYAGIHIAVALSLVSMLGIWLMMGQPHLALVFVAQAVTESIANYLFGVVPLFILMGLVVAESGMGRDTFAVVSHYLRGVRGGLGVATVLSNAIFAAVTGISIASAAVFARIAVPEMVRAGYDRRIAVGVVAGSSVLGMLIPPSLLMIFFAFLTDTSIGDLFLGGVGPGLLLTAAYSLYLLALGRLQPHRLEPAGKRGEPEARPKRRMLLPVFALAALVLGGIYAGFFTPTEAGAIGAFLAILFAMLMRRIGLREAWRITLETGHITASISLLIIGATIYSRMLSLSGVPASLTAWAAGSGLGPIGVMLLFSLLLILLGTILDSGSILLVTVPLAFPIAMQLGIDPVHFGLVTVIAVEIGLLTPPLGLSVFVVHSTLRDTGVTLGEVFRGALPFAAVMTAVLLAVIFYPPIVLAIIGR
ncbi:MAG: TRAP transporter large permease [Rhizobiaceae bacterium]|nr:TRAP transporter large permease [Rhizobiaceae bacterium]